MRAGHRHDRLTAEQRVALTLCGARFPSAGELDERLAGVDPGRLLVLLERLRIVTLAGARLRATGVRLTAEFEPRVAEATERAAARGRTQEIVLLSLTGELTRAGIRGVPLKGSALALAVHGDPALRVSGDLDVLVDPGDLAGAVAVAERMGWRALDPVGPPLPLLHVRLAHDALPPLELHWRVHWYEQDFAARALAHSGAPAPGQPLRLAPAEELASLLLFHVRDGLSGLRLAADVGAWTRSERMSGALSGEIAELAARHPALRPALAVGAAHLNALLGLALPVAGPLQARERAALRLANPFLAGPSTQVRADRSFVDILLAPPGGVGAAVRRQFDNAPQPPGGSPPLVGHVVRTLARWTASAARATVAPRPGAYATVEPPPPTSSAGGRPANRELAA